jgi:uncharacterized membrane protein
MLRASNVLAIVITVVYPLAVWWGQDYFEPRVLAVLLLLMVSVRWPLLKVNSAARWWIGGTVLLLGCAVVANVMLPLRLYPVLVNIALLGLFAYSLVFPPTMAERVARLREPCLPAAAIAYTRRVTQMWCVFFAANGAIALATALWSSPAVWWFYNGLLAYLLMGLLFGAEYCVRLYARAQRNA